MNLHQLKIFLEAVKQMNYTRAGKELSLSQSAISIQISELEKSLGVKLFEQIGKKLFLTEEGLTLEKWANKILASVKDAEIAIYELKGLSKGHIHIGASTTIGSYILPELLCSYKKLYPGIEINIEIANTSVITEKIRKNEIDFALTGREITDENLIVKPFIKDEIIPVSSPKNKICRKKKLSIKDIVKEPILVRESGSATRDALEKNLKKIGTACKFALEVGSTEALKRSVHNNLGISFISRFAVLFEIQNGYLIEIKLNDFKLTRQFYLVYLKEKYFSKAAGNFLEFIMNNSKNN